MAEFLCPSCVNSIFCDTWGEWKCLVKERRIYVYAGMTTCKDYKKRGKDFKKRKCQCEDCLRNELLVEEGE